MKRFEILHGIVDSLWVKGSEEHPHDWNGELEPNRTHSITHTLRILEVE